MSTSSKEFFDIQATTECKFTLKRVSDMVRTYGKMAKWLNVRLQTKWLWFRISLQSINDTANNNE